MERSNDDPIIWHERVLQVRVAFSSASPLLEDLVSDVSTWL